jgi:hypothetical protein
VSEARPLGSARLIIDFLIFIGPSLTVGRPILVYGTVAETTREGSLLLPALSIALT